MTNEASGIKSKALTQQTTAQSGAAKSSTTSGLAGVGAVGKDDFLKMLVAQLKTQDPLDPMKSEEFAVNLAQFTQVEQLIAINQKLDSSNNSADSSLVGYLGREVSIDSSQVEVKAHDGGFLKIDLPKDANHLSVDLLKDDGSIAETVDLGSVAAGKHLIQLSGLQADNGTFGYRVNAALINGVNETPAAFVAGIVSGFVPGPDPKLLVGSRSVSPSEIVEVGLVPQS